VEPRPRAKGENVPRIAAISKAARAPRPTSRHGARERRARRWHGAGVGLRWHGILWPYMDAAGNVFITGVYHGTIALGGG
jgi:hypothetical protein